MHWQASKKKTISEIPLSGVITGVPIGVAGFPQSLPEGLALLLGFPDAEDHPKRRDEHLSRSKRPDDSNPDLPVEADGPEGGLDGMPEPAAEATFELLGRFLRIEGSERLRLFHPRKRGLLHALSLGGVVLGDVR